MSETKRSETKSSEATHAETSLDPEKVLNRLTRRAGISRQTLEGRIEEERRQASQQDEHLSFDEVRSVDAISEERLQHIDRCPFCQQLVETLTPSEEMTNRFLKTVAKERSSLFNLLNPLNLRRLSVAAVSLTAAFFAGFWIPRSGKVTPTPTPTKPLVLHAFLERPLESSLGESGESFQAAAELFHQERLEDARRRFLEALKQGGVDSEALSQIEAALEAESPQISEVEFMRTARLIGEELQHGDVKPEVYLTLARSQQAVGKELEAYESVADYLTTTGQTHTVAELTANFLIPLKYEGVRQAVTSPESSEGPRREARLQ